MRLIIRVRILELYDSHGLAAFQFPGVQKAIDLLLDATSAKLPPACLTERALRAKGRLPPRA